MYAIALDLDTATLQASYGNSSWNNAYNDVKKVLDRYGFTRQQGSVYFGNEKVNAVTCVIATVEMTRAYPWFAASVRDIRMLKIEELNDLVMVCNDKSF